MRSLSRLLPTTICLRAPVLHRHALQRVISPALGIPCLLPRVTTFSASQRSLFSTATAAPITNTQPPVPVTESTQPESKLELDAFGEPRVMAWLPKVKTSPRKLNLVAKLVRRMGLEQALMQLRFCSKKMADVVSKTIHDAKWNAVNNNVSIR